MVVRERKAATRFSKCLISKPNTIRRETLKAVNKDLNLLSLRRWHYEHPEEYQEFTDLFSKAYEGDMTKEIRTPSLPIFLLR